MTGMHKSTGKPLSGAEHIAQSIADILTTPLGSCVMRREYGSRLFELVDTPLNARSQLLWIAATAGAIRRWEPRIALERVGIAVSAAGRAAITLVGRRTDIPTNDRFTLDLPL